MSKWKYNVDFSHFYRSNSFTLKEKALLIFKKLAALDNSNLTVVNSDFEDIVYNFHDFATCVDDLTVEDFDELMFELYNVADRNHLLWIKTF